MIKKLQAILYFFIFIACAVQNEVQALIKISNNTGDSITVDLVGHDTKCKSKYVKLGRYQKNVEVKYHSLRCKLAPINKVTIKGPKGEQSLSISGFGDLGDFHFYINSGHKVTCGDKKEHEAPYTVTGLPSHFYNC